MELKYKIFIKPAIKILDTCLDGLLKQIKEGNTAKAIDTIEEVRGLLKEAVKLLD